MVVHREQAAVTVKDHKIPLDEAAGASLYKLTRLWMDDGTQSINHPDYIVRCSIRANSLHPMTSPTCPGLTWLWWCCPLINAAAATAQRRSDASATRASQCTIVG
jgi:hypothetical protein